jgi:hypothetical protein
MTKPAIPEGWLPHTGGPCPVPLDSRPGVMFRDGEIAGRDFAAWHWDWKHSANQDAPDDIIAYLPEPENPDG